MISDRVSLSDKLRREIGPFISEDGAVDAVLSAVVDKIAPDEKGVGCVCSEHDGLARPDELASASTVSISVAGIMSLIEREAGYVPVLCEPPCGAVWDALPHVVSAVRSGAAGSLIPNTSYLH